MKRAAFVVSVLLVVAAASAADDEPWTADLALANSVWHTVVAGGGVLSIKDHAGDLEQALARAPEAIERTGKHAHPAMILVDGDREAVIANGLPIAKGDSLVTATNPYPRIAFMLGSYYDEIGKPEEAVRVLDKGLAADPLASLDAGAYAPYIDCERGTALLALKRMPQSLAAYEAGLKFEDLGPGVHAKLLRGRGYALTELNRLDEAEAAYRESLTFEPNNALALHELGYIAHLRQGAPRAPPGGIAPLQPPAGQPATGG